MAVEYNTSVRFCKVRKVPKVSAAHRDERRRQILDGARTAFAEHGYEGATVARLEQAIGLSRGAIFNYFPDKWELFYALAVEDQQRAGMLWLEHGFDGLVRHLGDENPEWIGVYLEVSRMLRTIPELRERWAERNLDLDGKLAAHLTKLQADGVYRSDLDIETLGHFLGVVLDGLIVQRGAGFPVDIEGTLELVRSALAPK
jgi:TetR/AcrR family transcriptional regulator, transcriptional repressor of aconitase